MWVNPALRSTREYSVGCYQLGLYIASPPTQGLHLFWEINLTFSEDKQKEENGGKVHSNQPFAESEAIFNIQQGT